MHQDYKLGIAGGIWASIIGVFYIIVFSLPRRIGPPLTPLWLLPVIVAVTLTGIFSIVAIKGRDSRPVFGFFLLWLSFSAVAIAFYFMNPFGLGLFVFPSMVLLLPAAIRMKWANAPSVIILGVLGATWAIVPGIIMAVKGLFFVEIMRTFSIISILEVFMGVLALIAIYEHTKRIRLAYLLILASIAGIFTALLTLAPDPVGIFETLPAVSLLIPAAFRIGGSLSSNKPRLGTL